MIFGASYLELFGLFLYVVFFWVSVVGIANGEDMR